MELDAIASPLPRPYCLGSARTFGGGQVDVEVGRSGSLLLRDQLAVQPYLRHSTNTLEVQAAVGQRRALLEFDPTQLEGRRGGRLPLFNALWFQGGSALPAAQPSATA
jgi:hypothetical protein